ncbi:MAG TPA: ribonuclease H-like domain-containing protein [Candidatus Acidoferrum sp.]|nr:ribonuclease H-like domain-containing protein [Candidatus Acidoferrum sp.]
MAALDKFARLAALRPAQGSAPYDDRLSPEDSPTPGLDECTLAKLLGATIATTKYGNHLSIRNWYAAPQLPDVAPAALDLLCRTQDTAKTTKWRAAAGNPEKWLFLDTETTGLSGGTGTYAFLIGIAWWDSGGLQVEQFMMRDFSEEHSVLLELAARIAERPVLVTFNGKTFDWPLLESRYLMTRCIRVPELGAHLDLLHPARAVWKLRLGSVRLVELERHVLDAVRLGWDRQDDVPSSMIPQFYFDYLRGRSPLPLSGVVRHNAMDLRGLAALFGKLNSLLDCKHGEDTDALDLFGLSRFLHRRGERGKAESTCVAARDRGLPLPFDAQARCELAQMAKRRGEHAAAALMWEELLEDAECRFTACEQLAVYHERRTKNFKKALEYARWGLQALTRQNAGAIYGTPKIAVTRRADGLSKRVARLEQRIRIAVNRNAAPLLRRGQSSGAAD